MVVGAGWDATLAKYKPEMLRKSLLTVGDFLAELRQHWAGRPKTFEDYCRSFRKIVSEIFNIKGGREKYDYVKGGRSEWIQRINRVKLSALTPDKINRWRIAFVKKAGGDPVKERRARISCNSILRQAKSLFSPKLLVHVLIEAPERLPFDGVDFFKRENMRYQSKLNVEQIVASALEELPLEELKIFLLAIMAGLAHDEIDKLQWKAFRWNESQIRMEVTEHIALKNVHRSDDVKIDRELVALFRKWHRQAVGPFVIDGGEAKYGVAYTHYRAQRHFDGLMSWLRSQGIAVPKPLHELRKEFGSQICAKHGIYTASRMLRHADIATTARHYLDRKSRVTVGLGGLLASAKRLPIGGSRERIGRTRGHLSAQ